MKKCKKNYNLFVKGVKWIVIFVVFVFRLCLMFGSLFFIVGLFISLIIKNINLYDWYI